MSKKAILVVSFGTSHKDTREKTINLIEQDIGKAFPDYKIYRAFTSRVIINILKNRDKIIVNTVEEALEQMKKEGMEEILIQPTHILNGIENDIMISEVRIKEAYFKSVKIGTPLLTTTEDYKYVIKEIKKELPSLQENEVIVWMGHGTTHYSNTSYTALQYMLSDFGYEDIFIATVEAYPSIDNIIKQLRRKNYKKVLLMPFMIVSGDHAINDMAGEGEDSWKSILEKEGYEVRCLLKGLGEYACIRKLLITHLEEAKSIVSQTPKNTKVKKGDRLWQELYME